MKKIYILTAIFALLTLSLNAQLLKVDGNGNVVPPKSQTGRVMAPNRADALIPGCSWDVNSDGTTLPSGWEKTANLSTNSDGSAYIGSSSGGTITIPSSLLQGNSTVKVVINAASYNGSTYTLSVNNIDKSVYDTDFSDYTWENVNAANGISIYMNSWNVSLISIKVYGNSDPNIAASPNNVTFKCAPNETATQTVSVTGANLTDDITATLNDPNNVYSINTTNLGTSGGNLTITYSPTAVGIHTATITLTSGSITATITLNGSCVEEVTVCDGGTTTGNLPIYGLWYDATNGQHNQMIYPSNLLTSLEGNDITSMTFYAPAGLKFSGGSVTFSIGETNTDAFSSATALTDNVTSVATVVPSGETEWTIVFSSPYTYNGGNLLIQVDSEKGSYGSTSFTGMSMESNLGLLSYNTSNSLQTVLPKVTFGYVANNTPKIEVSTTALTISDSGTNNTFTVQGSNLGNDNVGVTVPQGSAFSTTTSDQWWGFENTTGSVSGTVTVTYGGRDLSATETVTVANNLTSATVNVTYVPDLYIVGNFGTRNWDYSAEAAIPMTNNGDGTYTATLNDIAANSYILFSRKIGETYEWDNNRLFIGAVMDNGQDWEYGINEQPGSLDTDPSYPSKYRPIHFSEGGTYTVTIDANAYTFTITKLVLPPPENVEATASTTNQSATVTWDAPSDLPTVPGTVYQSVTEGFDDTSVFTSFSTGGITATQHYGAFGDWTLYDATGGAGVYYSNADQFDNEGEPQAWMPFNATAISANITAYSPDQYMESVCPREDPNDADANPVASDHWLISPELSGNAQTISFYERIITTQYGNETYQVLASSTDNNPASFSLVETIVSNATSWTERTVSLPAGTKYFAIRHISNDIFGMMVDDVTYEVGVPTMIELAPVSYNIYLDGVLVGSVPSTTDPLSYNFNNVADGEHTASVSAVYEGDVESAKVSDTFTILPKTPAPEISVATGETAYTITATAANPNATVTMTVDGVEYTGTGSVTATIDRGNADQSVYVSATAQEDGKLVSDPNSQYVNVPAIPVTPTPTITYEQTNSSVVITANGEGTITLTAGGQTVTGEGPISITIMRSLEDQNVTATATAVSPNHQTSDPATTTVPVPALSGTPAAAQEGLLRMHLLVVDQFKEPIPDDNSHPDRYGYILKWEQPANIDDRKESGSVPVDIEKTEAKVNGYYTLSDIESDIDRHLDLDVLTADVSMELPDENPNVLYYQLQGKKDANPALGEDYLTQLQYMKNIYEYEEMLQTSPNKGQHYEANSTYHYYNDWTSPVITGDYGVNFMTYAPSVSTWGIQRRYFEEDGLDNTYGAPIWKTGVGQVRMVSTEAQLQRGPYESTQWDGVGGPCSLVFLGVEALGDLPSTDVSNIVYEPYMFRVWIQSPHNNLRGCTLIPEDPERPVKPGEHWEGDGTVYGAEPILVYEGPTSDGHLFIDVEEPPMDNQPWNSRIQFGALDDGLDDLIVYVRFYYRSTGQGISGRNMMRGNRDDEVPAYNASEGEDNPNITTGIIELWNGSYDGEVVSRTYVNSLGMQSDEPFDGVNIVITRYSDGKVSTTKVIR